MSSFTDKLVVSKLKGKWWKVEREFEYYLDGGEIVTIPNGFETDFASVPRIFWFILPPDGNYTQAAVLHDFLYQRNVFTRKKCDEVFLDAMTILEVPKWKRKVMYRALRMFGWTCWRKYEKPMEEDKESV